MNTQLLPVRVRKNFAVVWGLNRVYSVRKGFYEFQDIKPENFMWGVGPKQSLAGSGSGTLAARTVGGCPWEWLSSV
jgi:hypothetical protein